MTEQIKKPEIVTIEHLEYLDSLRESGITNMYGAAPYLAEAFELSQREAKEILIFWMKTFNQDRAQYSLS